MNDAEKNAETGDAVTRPSTRPTWGGVFVNL